MSVELIRFPGRQMGWAMFTGNVVCSLSYVMRRAEADYPFTALDAEVIDRLVNWDAEKYRKGLNVKVDYQFILKRAQVRELEGADAPR